MNQTMISFSTEDRALLARIATALENLAPSCDSCARSVEEGVAEFVADKMHPATEAPPAVRPENATETADAVPPPVAHPADDVAPWADPDPTPAPVVGLAEFQKALTLRCAESDAMKAKVRALLQQYAPAASEVPEDKRAEILAKLSKL